MDHPAASDHLPWTLPSNCVLREVT
jgi:hypothetical protein